MERDVISVRGAAQHNLDIPELDIPNVVIIEHNLDVVRCANRVIDLGPEGGGGRVVAEGTPEQVARVRGSHTGRHLKPLLRER